MITHFTEYIYFSRYVYSINLFIWFSRYVCIIYLSLQVVFSNDTAGLTYCHQVSKSEYETQRLSNSQRALRDLLEEIINDKTMSYKDKKKRLKIVSQQHLPEIQLQSLNIMPHKEKKLIHFIIQFQKTYPDIYSERFPPHDSKSTEQLDQKSSSKSLRNQKNSKSKVTTSQDPKAALPPKPKLKQPLLVKPLLKLRGLRIWLVEIPD